MKKSRNEKGFTLIEIVMVIVLIGILGAIAIPRYFDLTTEARRAAVKGMAGGISGAMATNFAARTLNSANGAAVTNCTSATNVVPGGVSSAEWTITSAAITAGNSANCLIQNASFGQYSARFVAIGIN